MYQSFQVRDVEYLKYIYFIIFINNFHPEKVNVSQLRDFSLTVKKLSLQQHQPIVPNWLNDCRFSSSFLYPNNKIPCQVNRYFIFSLDKVNIVKQIKKLSLQSVCLSKSQSEFITTIHVPHSQFASYKFSFSSTWVCNETIQLTTMMTSTFLLSQVVIHITTVDYYINALVMIFVNINTNENILRTIKKKIIGRFLWRFGRSLSFLSLHENKKDKKMDRNPSPLSTEVCIFILTPVDNRKIHIVISMKYCVQYASTL